METTAARDRFLMNAAIDLRRESIPIIILTGKAAGEKKKGGAGRPPSREVVSRNV